MIKKPTVIGSSLSVLLLFSVFSYAQTLVQQQEPKTQPSSPPAQPNQNQPNIDSSPASESAEPASPADEPMSVAHGDAMVSVASEKNAAVAPQTYTATAYSLRGRTASGRPVSRGLIAADPGVLPLGTKVRLEAGSFSGEYVVADTGGAVRGRRIDIWTPSAREAMRFGRRHVKLTVLSFGIKRQKDSSRSEKDKNTSPTTPAK